MNVQPGLLMDISIQSILGIAFVVLWVMGYLAEAFLKGRERARKGNGAPGNAPPPMRDPQVPQGPVTMGRPVPSEPPQPARRPVTPISGPRDLADAQPRRPVETQRAMERSRPFESESQPKLGVPPVPGPRSEQARRAQAASDRLERKKRESLERRAARVEEEQERERLERRARRNEPPPPTRARRAFAEFTDSGDAEPTWDVPRTANAPTAAENTARQRQRQAQRLAVLLGSSQTQRGALRCAIVAHEILSPPLALRDEMPL